ncbi:hypothetical protein [Kitasatospora sp. McL0602]|uniref:hypothetical protein n=1 Tax=Kitasatospora sp. McL0602 TaxID=3439530 RepID=UPI003F897D3B
MELSNRHTALIAAATAALAAAAVAGVSAGPQPATVPAPGIVVEAHMAMVPPTPGDIVVPDHMALS